MSSSEPTQPTEEPKRQCANCSSTPEELKQCAKCHSVLYCNRKCQTDHWKTHKKDCSRLAGARASNPPPPQSNSNSTSTSNSNPNSQSSTHGASLRTPFTAISTNTFLHNRPESEVYKLLVDIVRLRQEDTYKFEGDIMPGTIYNEEPSSLPAFHTMLRKAKLVRGFLPPWWSEDKERECIREAREPLRHATEKSDVQEDWGDMTMPMKLRMLSEVIYGAHPGSGPGAREAMLAIQMQAERREGRATAMTFDHARGRFSTR